LLKVTWPQALPSIFAGLKVGLGFGWMCVVASEMFAANSGLGYLIQLNRQLLRLDRVVVGMLAIGLIGVIMTMLMGKLERLLLPWKYTDAKTTPSDFSEKIEQPQGNNAGAQLELSNLTFSYSQNTPLLSNITFSLAPGEILSIIGESGSGKTTLLRILVGLLPDNAQQAKLDGKPLNFAPENTTMVFQETSLFPWMTCLENIIFAIESKTQSKLTTAENRQKALYYLNLVGLKEKAHNYPLQLSGGQKQRVALARALAYEPKLLLLDEPFSALDSQTKEKLQEELSGLIKKLGLTAVFVTHDIREAVYLANKVALMQNGTIALMQCLTQPTPRQDAFRYSQEFAKVRSLLFDALRTEHPNAE
jgi:NitT/TauT family transport system ATP-binding protein